MTRTALFAALASSLAVAAGCGRAHLTPSHGEAFHRAFTPQLAGGVPPSRPPVMALDPQEADIIGKAYLQSLAGKGRVEAADPVLYVAPPQRAEPPRRLAPSVPPN